MFFCAHPGFNGSWLDGRYFHVRGKSFQHHECKVFQKEMPMNGITSLKKQSSHRFVVCRHGNKGQRDLSVGLACPSQVLTLAKMTSPG
jgi:hypothetical protein